MITAKALGKETKHYAPCTSARSSIIQQDESRSAVALSPGLGLVGALGVVAQLGTAPVVKRAWCQLWKQTAKVKAEPDEALLQVQGS